MKKRFCLVLAIIIALSATFAACSSKNKESGLDSEGNEFGVEVVEVTDENGEVVTDENGEPVTEEVYVMYTTDKKGNVIAVEIGENGEPVTDSKGKEVTIKTDYDPQKLTTNAELPTKPETQKPTESTTMQSNDDPTNEELTTLSPNKDKVPSTSESGSKVSFSNADQQIIKNMLEVPYLYNQSYENADGVPAEIATHAAIWMAEREQISAISYASGTIVLDLFKYFGQTVVNFKSNCNGAKNDNITYYTSTDTFKITSFEAQTHTVKLDSIEYLGNNNYYKVTASVSGAGKISKVTAIIQKNRLDASLGFSIKALKWS